MASSTSSSVALVWNVEMKGKFIAAIIDEIKRGNFTDSGFKAASWNRIVADFNQAAGVLAVKQQLQNQFSDLKKKYMTFKALVDNSGFGWDDELQLPTAPDDVWDAWMAKHPEAARFRTQTLPYFKELDDIFGGKVALGDYCWYMRAIESTDTVAKIWSVFLTLSYSFLHNISRWWNKHVLLYSHKALRYLM